MNLTKCSTVKCVSGAALLAALTGCVGYVDEPRHQNVHVQPPSVWVDSSDAVPDDYVYYPAYQVYYGSSRHQYLYLEGRSWVSRPAPPRVSIDVLLASPSVRLDSHDHPSLHHAEIARQYPKHWAPAESGHGNQRDHDEGERRK